MSVYTVLNQREISTLLSLYNLGEYKAHQGISAGVENTNYFVSTDKQELVLTIFEKHSADELPFFLELSEHLHNHHCAVPQPFRQSGGEFILSIKEKPGVFFERVTGGHVEKTEPYIDEIAIALANIHNATSQFTQSRTHSHNIDWVKKTAAELEQSLSSADQSLLTQAFKQLAQLPNNLPRGIIHADLFHDNALFQGTKLSGIIDWYFAGDDSFALDIAITINDWCYNQDKNKFMRNGEQFIKAYQTARLLSSDEMTAVPLLQIQSALRFWLSRLLAQREHGQSSESITVKDPNLMKQLLASLMP